MANCYRVEHTHGVFEVGEYHRICVDPYTQKFLQLNQLYVGDQIVTSVGPSRSIEELYQPESALDDRRWKQILSNSLESYAGCMSQYGLQLLVALGIDPISFQQLAYAQGYGPLVCSSSFSREDARMAQELAHNRNGLSDDPSGRKYFSHRMVDLFVALANRIAPKSFGHTFLEALSSLQSLCCFEDHQKKKRLVEPSHVLPLDAYSSISTIKSIEFVGKKEIWDLTVLGTRNYITEDGAVHHNSGKTACAIQELIACAIEYPGTKWIIGRQTYQSLKDTTWADFYEAVPDAIIKSYNKSEMIITLVNDSKFYGRALDGHMWVPTR